MPTLDTLLQDLDQALTPECSCEAAVCHTCELLRRYSEARVQLPERVTQQASDRYARHLVYQKEQDGYVVVVMVWGPGQGTPVHDHGGTWCVEGCLRGKLEITSYRMLGGASEGEVSFQRESTMQVGPGAVGCLIPPFEHHKIHNPYGETAITLHVYGQELRQCTRFLEVGPDRYRPEKVSLCYTSTPVGV